MTKPSISRAPVSGMLKGIVFWVLKAATVCLAPIQGVVIAAIRFCRKRDLLFLSDWRADVSPFVVSCKGAETYVVDTSDTTIGVSIRKSGEFDFEKFEYALSLMPKHFRLHTMYDIGANIGIICIPAVARGIAQRAVAFEPEPRNYRLLVANIYLNGLQDLIEHHNIALGAADGEQLRFELAGSNYGDHRVRVASESGKFDESNRTEIVVNSETFDSIAQEIDPSSSLLWMDVQGYEGHVLAGATKAMRSGACLVTEFWPYGLKRANSLAAFREAIGHYHHYFDLSVPNAVAVPVSRIDDLFTEVGYAGDSTDILLC